MGRGIIFVGGSSQAKEGIVYKNKGKLRDNWGMYKKAPKPDVFDEEKALKELYEKNRRYGNDYLKKQLEARERFACYQLVRSYANELHPLKIRGQLSTQIHRNYNSVPQEQISRILNAYYKCCVDPRYDKKGQINTLRLGLEEYLISEGISPEVRSEFLVKENANRLSHHGRVDVVNVVNSIHRCFLLNKSVPQRMQELALGNEVKLTKEELAQLAELYRIILNKIETDSIKQICSRHNFSFHSKNARRLLKRITEFVVN